MDTIVDYLTSYTVWQGVTAAAATVLTFWLLAKNRTVYAKLVVLATLTILMLLQVTRPPEPKETPRDRAIRTALSALDTRASQLSAPKGLDRVVERLDKLLKNRRQRYLTEKVEPQLEALEAIEFDDPGYAQTAAQLAEEWRARIKETPAKLREELAELRTIPEASRSERQRERIDAIVNMLPKWYDRLPFNLGLDLRGGTEIRLRLRPDETKLRRLLDERDEIARTLKGEERATALEEIDGKIETEERNLKTNYAHAVDIIRDRVNLSGLAEISVSRQGDDRVLLQLPGMGSTQARRITERVTRLGRLEFRLAVTAQKNNRLATKMRQVAAGAKTDMYNFSPRESRFLEEDEIEFLDDEKRGPNGEALYDWLHDDDGNPHVVEQKVRLTGEYINFARAEFDAQNPPYYRLAFGLTPQGGMIFGHVSGNNVKEPLAIVLDGRLRSAPIIKERMTTSGVITGKFDAEEAKNLEVVFVSGSLKVKPIVEFENTVGPTLGQDSIRQGALAMAIGLGAVLVFMLGYYRIAGAVTDFVLMFNVLMIIGILAGFEGFKATLTLPGIAGLILTVGMAVDANVLIFERIREEREKGNTLGRAIALGYERAFITILDANVTTLITALILHQFGTEAVRGFATTFIAGIVTSMFCSLVVTRWVFEALLEWKVIGELRMHRFFEKPAVPFAAMSRPAMVASLVLILVGLGFVGYRGQRNLGHDFTGGVYAQINLTEPMTIDRAREIAQENLLADFDDLSIQSYGQPDGAGYTGFILRTARVRPLDIPLEDLDPALRERKTAQDFKRMVEAAYPLQPEGLRVRSEPLADVAVDGVDTSFFRVELTLRRAERPGEIERYLERAELIAPRIYPQGFAIPPIETARENPGSDEKPVLQTPEASESEPADTEATETENTGEEVEPDAGGGNGGAEPAAATAEDETPAAGEHVVDEEPAAVAAEDTGETEVVEVEETAETETFGEDGSPHVAVEVPDAPVKRLVVICGVRRRDRAGTVKTDADMASFIADQFRLLRQERLFDYTEPFPRFTNVGPAVARDMMWKAGMALIFSMAVIFFYIWLRFQFRATFGAGAIVALAHDVFFTLGALAIVDELGLVDGQITLVVVAALLTLVGYSLNDTIVVFDRIRENLAGTGRPIADVINDSINQTLTRTVVTSMTTMLVVLALLLWGGDVIRGFAFALFIGILVGTYSSVFIASPILIEFTQMRARRREERYKRKDEES